MSLNNLKLYLFLSLCLTFVKLENIKINFNETKIKGNVTANETISFEVTNNLSSNYNYIKIEVIETSKKKNIISFYQKDSKYNDRKQLSKSLGGKSIMWLTKQQAQDKFYLTVECDKKPCNYEFNLLSSEVISLLLEEQYTYYVTKETENMTFNIIPQVKKKKNIIFIYGQREIKKLLVV